MLRKMLISLSVLLLFSGCRDREPTTVDKSSVQNQKTERILIVVAHSDSKQNPIVFKDGSGISSEIIKELNKIQSKYQFVHKMVPNKRMKILLPSGEVNVVAFSNLNFGWDKKEILQSSELIQDRDVYFTLKEEGKDQSFFEDFSTLKVVGVKGFHYNFDKTKTSFIEVQNEKAVLEMVLLKRGDIGVASTLGLKYLSKAEPETYSKLLFAEKPDKEYKRFYLLKKDGPISVKEINSYVETLKSTGTLQKIYEKYGLIDSVITDK